MTEKLLDTIRQIASCATSYHATRYREVQIPESLWADLIDQLDRDALEAATPCPDCTIKLGNAVYAVVSDNVLHAYPRMGRSACVDCKTVADLRQWCAALKVEMPDVGGRR